MGAHRKLPSVDEVANNRASHDFHYLGWKVKIELEGAGSDGIVSGRADLFEDSKFICRVMLSAHHRDGSSAIQALARKARAVIDEWQLQANH